MKKRDFLTAALGGAMLPSMASAARPARTVPGPTLLTVSGNIGKGTRGALDPALDQLMKKQGVQFAHAHAFDYRALLRLPSREIRPTLEYDGKPHALRGPLLVDVLRAAGVPASGPGKAERLVLRAIDGYAPAMTMADAEKFRFIVATRLDGRPLPLGGLGPLWAVFDADAFAQVAARPLNERYGLCPWGLYHIDVR